MRYTATSGAKKRASTAKPTAKAPSAPDLKALYQQVYPIAVQQLREGVSGAALRGQLHNQGLAHPQVLKAVTDAEKYLANEAKQQVKQQARAAQRAQAEEAKRQAAAKRVQAEEMKQQAKAERAAAQEPFVQQAAQQLRDGVPFHKVMRWLKHEQRGRYLERSDIISRAQKIAKAKA